MKQIPKEIISELIEGNSKIEEITGSIESKLLLFGNYPRAVDIRVIVHVPFRLIIAHPDGTRKVCMVRTCIDSRYIIKRHLSNAGEYARTILSHMIDDITERINDYNIDRWMEFESLDIIDDEECYQSIEGSFSLTAWSGKEVGIWYVEQECGEGWIKLPLEPPTQTTSVRIDMTGEVRIPENSIKYPRIADYVKKPKEPHLGDIDALAELKKKLEEGD